MDNLVELKNNIILDLKDLEKNKNIHSLHLIGSHTDQDKKLDKINDFDVLVLLNSSLNGSNYSSVSKSLQKICDKFESKFVHIMVETKHANVKLKPTKEINIQLHQLTFFYKDFIKGFNSGNLALHNWVLSSKKIFGKSLQEIVNVKPIFKEQLNHERDSINFFIKIINEKKNEGTAHLIEGKNLIKKPVSIPVTEHDELELFYIAINETLGNLLKYNTQRNIVFSFEERREFLDNELKNVEYSKVFDSLKLIKEKLRNCEEINFDFDYFKKITLSILEELKKKFNL